MPDNKTHIACPSCNALNKVAYERLTDGPKCGKCKYPLFQAKPVVLNSGNFSSHALNSDLPVVVDFWAPWCGPCQMMAPQFEAAAAELEPYVRLAKVDTEAEQMLGGQFNIRSIPTIVMFKQGREIARQSGAMMKADLVRWVKSNLM